MKQEVSFDTGQLVDGYEVEFTYNGNPTDGKQYHGENLREALRKAMSAAPNYDSKEG